MEAEGRLQEQVQVLQKQNVDLVLQARRPVDAQGPHAQAVLPARCAEVLWTPFQFEL